MNLGFFLFFGLTGTENHPSFPNGVCFFILFRFRRSPRQSTIFWTGPCNWKGLRVSNLFLTFDLRITFLDLDFYVVRIHSERRYLDCSLFQGDPVLTVPLR